MNGAMTMIPLLKASLVTLAQGSTESGSAEAGNEALLVWVFALFGIAIALGVLEIFIPSGGIIGVVAFLCALAAVAVAFRIGSGYGMSAVGFLILATPSSIWLGLKVFPSTPVGRKIILSDGSSPEDLQQRQMERREENQAISSLVGAHGVTLTALRPGGTIRIEDEDVEAFAETGMIESGEEVEVVSVHGRQLKVRPATSKGM